MLWYRFHKGQEFSLIYRFNRIAHPHWLDLVIQLGLLEYGVFNMIIKWILTCLTLAYGLLSFASLQAMDAPLKNPSVNSPEAEYNPVSDIESSYYEDQHVLIT